MRQLVVGLRPTIDSAWWLNQVCFGAIIVTTLVGLFAAILSWWQSAQMRELIIDPNSCVKCLYSVGTQRTVCPECGTTRDISSVLAEKSRALRLLDLDRSLGRIASIALGILVAIALLPIVLAAIGAGVGAPAIMLPAAMASCGVTAVTVLHLRHRMARAATADLPQVRDTL